MIHYQPRVAVRAMCAFTVGVLALACADLPAEPEPTAVAQAKQAAMVPLLVDEGPANSSLLSGALADLTERIIPAIPSSSATRELADAIDELQTAMTLNTGFASGARVERVIAALQMVAATSNGSDAAADLEVGRLAIEQAIALVEPAARSRLSARLFTKTPIIMEAE